MPDETPTEDDNEFVSVARLLLDGISVGVIAAAIEKDVYTWDRFGRFDEATKGNSDDVASQKYALDRLAEYHQEHERISFSPTDDEAAHHLDQWVNDNEHPLWRFGWIAKSCPDFETLQSKYRLENTSKPSKLEKDPPSHASIYKLLKGLVHIAFGPEVVKDLARPKSSKLSIIDKKLYAKGYKISKNTLRKYLKHLPDD